MNVRAISALQAASLTRGHNANHIPAAFGELRTAISRRQFARNAAGTAVLGATFGSLWRPGLAEAKTSFAPVPIPGATPVLGGSYHVFGPAAFDPTDAEPSTITNFNGFVGLAYISGMVTQTNVKTGEKLRFPFVDSDMRFMKGEFQGTDRRMHHGAFALI
jgi:hypothetical protein